MKWLPKQPKNKIHIIKSGLLLGLWVFDGEWNLWMCQKHLVKTEVLQNRNAEFRKWLNPKFYATIQAEKKPCHQNSLSFEMKLGCKEVGRLFLGLSYICLPTHIHTTSMPLDNLKEGFFFRMFLANVKLGKPFSHQRLWWRYFCGMFSPVVLDSNYLGMHLIFGPGHFESFVTDKYQVLLHLKIGWTRPNRFGHF